MADDSKWHQSGADGIAIIGSILALAFAVGTLREKKRPALRNSSGLLVFVSERSGSANLWCCALTDLRASVAAPTQMTFHQDFDVESPGCHDGRCVYAHGGGLRIIDLGAIAHQRRQQQRIEDISVRLDVRLASAASELQRFVSPLTQLEAANLNHDGTKVVITARGRVFVAVCPSEDGQPLRQHITELAVAPNHRARHACFAAQKRAKHKVTNDAPPAATAASTAATSTAAASTAAASTAAAKPSALDDAVVFTSEISGALETWLSWPAGDGGLCSAQQSFNGAELRVMNLPSPDGCWVAYHSRTAVWLHSTPQLQALHAERSGGDGVASAPTAARMPSSRRKP